MKYALLILPLALVGCMSTEALFREHVVYMRSRPAYTGEATVPAGANDGITRVAELLSPRGIEYICRKAVVGTTEERIIASRLYTFYVSVGATANLEIPAKYDTSDVSIFSRRCAELVNKEKMIKLHNGLESLGVPAYLKMDYEASDDYVKKVAKETSNKEGDLGSP